MSVSAPVPTTPRSPDLGGTGPTRGRLRPTVRAVDGASQLRLLTITGIVTMMVIRFYLARTGYPQLGNGTLHIAHALWGGLLLLIGLATALLFVAARRTAAVLGGIGLGLFIDEIGKLVSRQHDYFFPLAPALIYLVFAALLVWSALWERDRKAAPDPSDTASAAQIAVEGLSLASCRWFKAVVLVDLLVVAVFNFAGSRWAALAFLPANLVVLALVSGLIRHEGLAGERRGLLTATWTLASRARALLPRLRTPVTLHRRRA